MYRIPQILAAAGVVGVLLAATACSDSGQTPTDAPSANPTPSSAGPNGSGRVEVNATFGRDDAAPVYDKNLVPDGSKVFVASYVHDGLTTVTMDVRGLLPNREYGVHVHTKPCGPKGEDAGPHFQHTADPVQPSVDPMFANDGNEIWLDIETDETGNASTVDTVEWTFGPTPAGSVVIHAEPTKVDPGVAGVAGARVACVSVGF